MSYLVLGVGFLLSIAGALAAYQGYGIVEVERGWTGVIAGSIVFSCGIVTMALALILRSLGKLHAVLEAEEQSLPLTNDLPSELRVRPGISLSRSAPRFHEPEPEHAAGPAPAFAASEGMPRPLHHEETGEIGQKSAMDEAVHVGGLDKPRAWEHFARIPQEREIEEPPAHEPGDQEAREQEFLTPPSRRPETVLGAGPDEQVGESHYPSVADHPLEPETGPSTHFAPHLEPEPSEAGSAELEAFIHGEIEAGHHEPPESEIAEPPMAEPVPPPPAAPVSKNGPLSIIGRYEAEGTTYLMFSDGSIEARSARGVFRFKSMAELKTFMEGQA